MPPLQRFSSSSTISTVTHSDTSIADMSESNPPASTPVPYIRRRNTPQQLKALQQLLELTPHPTREQRLALAAELGMELKSVTNWFQNRRQTEKRKSLIWNENNPPKIHAPPSQSRRLKQRHPNKSISSFSVSLDKIAQLSERPSSPSLLLSANRAPLTPFTPRTTNVRVQSSPSPSELWKYIPSSPAVSQSSPGVEEARLAGLPSRSKTWRSLEWACLKARRDRRVDDEEEEDGLPCLPSLSHGGGSDNWLHEALTPDSSVQSINLSPQSNSSSLFGGEENNKGLCSDLSKPRQSEDVEAALTLLGFMARR
ncbi:uncharacterized protein BJ212DRAFT_1301204 [Suillus subaureus]|uniref:Homeobox domain-containing protein n=1 Tax=Suillus subaureus TaxID=48587 RepID=A0A9P7JBW7_9AGAM|nr:uncharacterized protein BJ212DRAFT_1301204 [Suillus subaureus]KAG1813310.1 hypothetical protein BJ212DRAFT_1301204 [Suillus subaureus]